MTPLDKQMRSTYRYLRMSMPLLGLVLAISVVLQVFSTDPTCWLGSISAYYYTPARAIFVASLCAIGAALVVFKAATTREDTALNIAGVGAFTLALIPTPLRSIEEDQDFEKCSRSNEPTAEQLRAALENNALTLIIGVTLLAVTFWICYLVLGDSSGKPKKGSVFAATGLALVGWAGYLGWQASDASVRDVEKVGHTIGTVCLFVGITFIILTQLWPGLAGRSSAESARGPYQSGYRLSLAIIVLGAIIFVPLWLAEKANGLFWFETSMITAFIVFWSLQTIEKWGLDGTRE